MSMGGGFLDPEATVSVTLGAATASSGADIKGVSLIKTLANATVTSAANLETGKTGRLAVQLDAALAVSDAAYTNTTSLSVTLDGTSVVCQAVVAGDNTASLSKTLAATTATATATATSDPSGFVLKTLDAATASVTSTIANGLSCSVSKTLESATLSGTATAANGPTGAVARTLATTTMVSTAAYPPPQNAHLFFNVLRGVD